jgi:hypothetical protein
LRVISGQGFRAVYILINMNRTKFLAIGSTGIVITAMFLGGVIPTPLRLTEMVLGSIVSAPSRVADNDFVSCDDFPGPQARPGAKVLIDAAHRNFHTRDGSYKPFADLLRCDGMIVLEATELLKPGMLDDVDVLVIAMAAAKVRDEEVRLIETWVRSGGALLLIGDHHPKVKQVVELASVFGIRMLDATALQGDSIRDPIVFSKSAGTLIDHPVTAGIESVATFNGTSLTLEGAGDPLMVFSAGAVVLDKDSDEAIDIAGSLQGAVLTYGAGRVAVFGEAAMFTAQLSGYLRQPIGMNADVAAENMAFVRNLMRWLTAADDQRRPPDSVAPVSP